MVSLTVDDFVSPNFVVVSGSLFQTLVVCISSLECLEISLCTISAASLCGVTYVVLNSSCVALDFPGNDDLSFVSLGGCCDLQESYGFADSFLCINKCSI